MPTNPPSHPTAERLIAATLELIEEEGGSLTVNLRQVARRVGCAHTNVYNYFPTYQDLLWAAFRRALDHYGERLVEGLSTELEPDEYLERVLHNLASYPEAHPGLYRFIAADPIDLTTIPEGILSYVTGMKDWLAATCQAAAGTALSVEQSIDAADIVLAYIDGETLNLINGRAIPRDDIRGRVTANAMRLFQLLSAQGVGNADHDAEPVPDPQLIFAKKDQP